MRAAPGFMPHRTKRSAVRTSTFTLLHVHVFQNLVSARQFFVVLRMYVIKQTWTLSSCYVTPRSEQADT